MAEVTEPYMPHALVAFGAASAVELWQLLNGCNPEVGKDISLVNRKTMHNLGDARIQLAS